MKYRGRTITHLKGMMLERASERKVVVVEERIRSYLKRHSKAGLEKLAAYAGTNETIASRIKRKILAEKQENKEGTLEERIKKHLQKNITSFSEGHFVYDTKAVWAAVNGSKQTQVCEIADLVNKKNSEETEKVVSENIWDYVTNDSLGTRTIAEKMSADFKLYPQFVNYVLINRGIYHNVGEAMKIADELKQPLKKVGKIYFAVKNPHYLKNGEVDRWKILRDLKLSLDDELLVKQISTYSLGKV